MDVSEESFGSTDNSGQALNDSRQEDIEQLKANLRELIGNDESIKEARMQEALSENEVEEQASALLAESSSDEVWDLQRKLKSAQEKRDILLKDPWYYWVAIGAVAVGFYGLLALLGVGIAKWTGHLLRWPLWPLVVFPSILFLGGFIAVIASGSDSSATTSATVEAERLKSSLNEVLLLLIDAAIRRLASLNLIDPSDDVVQLTDAPSLSSRIESGSRIQTESYRDILTSLRREGGVTIGLAGSRGVGKSELLRAFCDDPGEQPSIQAGGVIGIVIPAPVAYEARSFLRALIRRLAEAVPEYAKHINRRSKITTSKWGLTMLLLAALCLAVGLVLDPEWAKNIRHTVGLVFILSAGLMVLAWGILALVNSSIWESMIRAIRMIESIIISFTTVPWLIWRIPVKQGDSETVGTQINQTQRRRLSVEAANAAQRVSYVEKRSASSESSMAWNNFGFKRETGIDLDQVPLTEPDLVAELSKLVAALHRGGYQIRIGIDELDKLSDGKEAERFLTGIKVLFSIRNCSFMLTISEDAAAQFARRGMPIRDVFDSSLDTVIVVQPLTFYEARRLVRARLSAGQSGKISDSQVLLCHYLAGGLPRDLLRFYRQLGELNYKAGGNSALKYLMEIQLCTEVNTRIAAVRFALRSRERGGASAAFMAELDRLIEAVAHKDVFRMLNWFLSTDPDFAWLCADTDAEATAAGSSYLRNQDEHENWIQGSRRQLYTFVYFIETVRQTFEHIEVFHPDTGGIVERPGQLELLAEARRWMELDAATGWRRMTRARLMFRLALPSQPSPAGEEQKGSC